MNFKRVFGICTISITVLFSVPQTNWDKQNISIIVNRGLLQGDNHLLQNFTRLQYFYQQRQNRPLWLSSRGIKGKKVTQLLYAIQKDVTLNPRSSIHSRAKRIKQQLTYKHTESSIRRFELELTTLYYDFLQHTIYGEINWKNFEAYLSSKQEQGIDNQWVRYPLKIDINRLMSQENILQTVNSLTPQGYHYKQLQNALYKLYKIKWQGGWGRLPAFKTLKKGHNSFIIPRLRKRLMLSGDYIGCSAKLYSTYYDECLQKAVKRFQTRHNVLADGVVGKGTQKLLNISVERKIQTLLLNLDRIKWLPRGEAARKIVVNIPEYMLHYYEYGQEQKRLRVIVGNPEHPTPIFSDELSYLTLNPYWKIPASIIKKEVVPSMIKNPNYLRQHGFEIHTTWEENSTIISPKSINWSSYLDETLKFPYKIMQRPSPKNALGRIKFKFPNKFSVYLHDTPTKHLFKKKRRAFSHGCIRLSNPFSLLQNIAKDEPNITPEMVNSTISSKVKREIDITNDIPINLVYLTTWVNNNNQLMFGDDIYHYDKYQLRK